MGCQDTSIKHYYSDDLNFITGKTVMAVYGVMLTLNF